MTTTRSLSGAVCFFRRRWWIFFRKPAQSRWVPSPRWAPKPTPDTDAVFYPRERYVASTSTRNVGLPASCFLGHEADCAGSPPSGTPSPPPHTPGLHASVFMVSSGREPRTPNVSMSQSRESGKAEMTSVLALADR